MAHWGNTESGILRKNKIKESHDDLLVFGYACKLFRDDDKASYIDKGKHLIPWMGDDKLKIDRYDCRGALSDIAQYEASREGFDAMRWLGLDDSERKIEQTCDKERYYSLHINEEEEQMYKEEELKREKANEFQYSYDVPSDPAQQEIGPAPAEVEEEDEEYVPSPHLDVPVDIGIPKTVKENARIEKTALFICKQGPQMEILIKAKQAGNPQFGFLNQGHNLYKYYRHVLSAIKSGRHLVVSKTEEKREENTDTNDGHYLHPSLVSAAQLDVQTSSIPSVPYKPSANCSYTQLVSKIQGGGATAAMVVPVEQQQHLPAATAAVLPDATQKLGQQQGTAALPQQMTYEQQQQYYQYYYASQYYEYYKQLAQYQQQGGDSTGQAVQPPEVQLDPAAQAYIQQMAYLHMQQQHPTNNNPYAQIVSNVNKDVSNPYAALLANIQQHQQVHQQHQQPEQKPVVTAKEPVIYTTEEPPKQISPKIPAPASPEPAAAVVVAAPAPTPATSAAVVLKKPLLSLAEYGTDSDEDSDDDDAEIPKAGEITVNMPMPTGDTQVVIDKMAMYVSKNGLQFEKIVKAKGDPRFEFLNETHEFYKYYRSKIKEYQGGEKKPAGEKEKVPLPHKPKEKKVIAPVCFSIKKPKEEAPKEIKSALPVEESDEEDGPPVATAATVVAVAPVPMTLIVKETEPTSPSPNEAMTTPINNTNPTTTTSSTTTSAISTTTHTTTPTITTSPLTITTISSSNESSSNNNNKNGLFDPIIDDPILEMIDLTEDLEEKKDARRAEDKIKDKLAAAAREKMVSVARDRALQLERKKKAAAFLKLKSAEVVQEEPKKVIVEEKKEEPKEREKTKSPPDVKKREVVEVPDDDSDENGDRKRRSSKRKKSHKRKHSKSKRDSSRSKKKSKKKRRRSDSESSAG